jgi:hypothetical protein
MLVSHELLDHPNGPYHDRNQNGSIAWNIPLVIPHSLLVMDNGQQRKGSCTFELQSIAIQENNMLNR